jgi:apyrase
MRRLRRETFSEKCHRYRGVIFVVCVPLALISVVLVLMPRIVDPRNAAAYDANFELPSDNVPDQKRYAVIFDAGSSGSRVHVFSFDKNLQLVKVGSGELEVFVQKKPGLSSYALNPKAGAESLQSLLDVALKSVPADQHSTTPVLLGATAGLRLLPGDQSKNLLKEVDTLLQNSAFKFKPEWVSIIDGTQEGSYQWVTVNYLLNRLGKAFDQSVGIVDLGGGSVQMAYAISDDDFLKAPKPHGEEQAYVRKMSLMGASYNLYVHSYLNYGLLAARAEVLQMVGESETCPCLAKGFEGSYTYGGQKYTASASADGGDYEKCNQVVVKALKADASCESMRCTFGGVWSGGGGDGMKSLFVASFFFDRALEAGIVKDAEAAEAEVKPSDFEAAAKKICSLSVAELAEEYPNVQEDTRKFLCMDLTYQYSLIVTGFQVDPNTKVTLVKKVKYRGSYVETAWPLGSAIELVSLNKV